MHIFVRSGLTSCWTFCSETNSGEHILLTNVSSYGLDTTTMQTLIFVYLAGMVEFTLCISDVVLPLWDRSIGYCMLQSFIARYDF